MECQLSFADVLFSIDSAKVFRIDHDELEIEKGNKLFPKKHQPEDDFLAELNRLHPFQYIQEFKYPSVFPGKAALGLAQPSVYEYEPTIEIGDFYYPPTASKWSVFRGLATSSQVKLMVAATSGNYKSRPFIMKSVPAGVTTAEGIQRYTIQTDMYMLPPRPIGDHGGGFDGLYLVTLVDERYYFQGTPISLKVTKGSTWLSLLETTANALNIEIGTIEVDDIYSRPEPDSHLWNQFENAALMLDALAYNIGRIVVRNLDGTYSLLRSSDSKTLVDQNRLRQRYAGGTIFHSGNTLNVQNTYSARNTIVPRTVNVTFPKYVIGNDPVPHFLNERYENPRPTSWHEDGFGGLYRVSIPISSGGSAVSGITGVSETTLHTTAKALYSGEMDAYSSGYVSGSLEVSETVGPLNASGLLSMSLQLAKDFYDRQALVALDESYPGTYKWTPEGIHDIIWTYSATKRKAATRICKSYWNTSPTEFQLSHHNLSGFLRIPPGMGGHSVAQTNRDSFKFSGYIPWTYIGELLSGSMTVAPRWVGYFPTQNRWKGIIVNNFRASNEAPDDNSPTASGITKRETVLFEAASGFYPNYSILSGIMSGSISGMVGGVTEADKTAIQNISGKLQIVFRGIDGTLEQDHESGSIIFWDVPNTNYGINLVSFEKSQFAFPGTWTSGGVQELVIPPQTQTVQVLCNSGTTSFGFGTAYRNYFSGIVNTFNTQIQSGKDFVSGELCWIVERNAGSISSGKRYDGQLVGFSADDISSGIPPAPVYLVNEAVGGGSCGIVAVYCQGNELVVQYQT